MFKVGDIVGYKDNPVGRRIRDINAEGELLLWGFGTYIDPRNVKEVQSNKVTAERIKKAREIEKELINILDAFDLKGRTVKVYAGNEVIGYTVKIIYPNWDEESSIPGFMKNYFSGAIAVGAALDYRTFVRYPEGNKWQ